MDILYSLHNNQHFGEETQSSSLFIYLTSNLESKWQDLETVKHIGRDLLERARHWKGHVPTMDSSLRINYNLFCDPLLFI